MTAAVVCFSLAVAAHPAAAQAAPVKPASGLLPAPGGLLPAPKSLAQAEREIAPLLAQARSPKTAAAAIVRLLVNVGVTIANGTTTVDAGRRGGPPLVMQAGQVAGLAQDLPGAPVALGQLLTIYADGGAKPIRKALTPSFYGRNFAAEITGGSDSSEYLWAAALIGSDTSAKGLVASLDGAGTPADGLAPLQVQLLSLRLESDVLGVAKSLRPKHGPASAMTPALPAGEEAPCDISYIPESMFQGISTVFGHGWEEGLERTGFLEHQAEAYGAALGVAAIAATVPNFAVMLFAMDVTTSLQKPFVRTQSTTADGRQDVISSTFTFPTSKYQWVNCARAILNLAGLDGSVPEPVLKNTEVTWGISGDGSDAAFLVNDSAYTNKDGTARTVIEGRRQPYPLGQPVEYTRQIDLTASINPRSTLGGGDRLASDILTSLEAVLGGISGGYISLIAGALPAAVAIAEEAGVLRRSQTVTMTDYYPFPTAFSATFTFSDPNAGGTTDWSMSSAGSMTVPKGIIRKQATVFSADIDYPLSGDVKYSYLDICSGTVAASSASSAQIVIAELPPWPQQLEGAIIQVALPSSTGSDGCPGGQEEMYPTEAIWRPGLVTATTPLQSATLGPDGQVVIVGSMTFHWYYQS